MSYDFLLRAVAGLAAVAILGAPAASFVARKVRGWLEVRWASGSKGKADNTEDMHTVLELASRLRAAGNVPAVHLCQQLSDVMLAPGAPL